MRRVLRDNGLVLAFLALFVLCLIGQALAGNAEFNAQQVAEGGDPIGLLRYVTSADFAVDVTENWQSEYLQFLLYVTVTVWLVQKGSPESKPPDAVGRGTDEEQKLCAYAQPDSPRWARVGGWRTRLYSHSLGLVMGTAFFGSWLAQSLAGRIAFNAERLGRREDPLGWLPYVTGPEFWSRSLQNWQSEMLAVASMAGLAVWLRERGSPESKPVGAPHGQTGR